MISFAEAIAQIASTARCLGTETIALADAAGRRLAEPVIARIDSPRADVSSMDGYAVRDADLEKAPATLRVVGTSSPGSAWGATIEPGTCARIFTGAPVPTGADRVIIQELVRRNGDLAVISKGVGEDRYVRRSGSDFEKGETLLDPGRLLDPRALVAAAAADVAELEVYQQPRVHVLGTGDELAEPGSAHATTSAIPDSVTIGVAAFAEQWGGRCVGRKRLADDLMAMQSAAAETIDDADVVVVTGGASVGERDFAKAIFEPAGIELIFSKLAIKPGKPAWLGRVGGCLILGLPGNPTSAMVTARLLLAPLLALMQGQKIEEALNWASTSLGTPLPPCDTRETFRRGVLREGAAQILSFQDSGAQKALAEADLLVRQPAHSPALAAGTLVETLAF